MFDAAATFIDRLSQHLLCPLPEQVHKIPCVRLNRIKSSDLPVSVKLEVEACEDDDDRTDNNSLNTQPCCNCSLLVSCNCALCSIALNSSSSFHYCSKSSLSWQKHSSSGTDRIVQEIFHKSFHETLEELRFCERCFQSVESLRQCYLKLAKVQEEFQEALIRIRCFKTLAAKASSIVNEDDDDGGQFGYESFVSDCETSASVEQSEVEEKVKSHVEVKRKSNHTGNSIRRRGGLTEEEYQEHRRKQMAGYYLKKKRKMGRLYQENASTHRDYGSPFRPKRSKKALRSTTSDGERRFGEFKIKRKYEYKGKTIRRRGGLTEEQYQAHRRAQNAQYYFEKRKKLGKLMFGPKPLNANERTKLEKARKVCVDSNSLPAKSSCGFNVPVIELEAEKRYSYRNVEFTKDEEGMLQCDKCGRTAKVLNVLKKHIAKIHFDKEFGYRCSQCDKTFYYQFQLKNHEGRHNEKGAGIQCEECGRSFKYSAGYYSHRRIIHQGVKPHECKPCRKQFGTRKDLRKHVESKSHKAAMRALADGGIDETEILQNIEKLKNNTLNLSINM